MNQIWIFWVNNSRKSDSLAQKTRVKNTRRIVESSADFFTCPTVKTVTVAKPSCTLTVTKLLEWRFKASKPSYKSQGFKEGRELQQLQDYSIAGRTSVYHSPLSGAWFRAPYQHNQMGQLGVPEGLKITLPSSVFFPQSRVGSPVPILHEGRNRSCEGGRCSWLGTGHHSVKGSTYHYVTNSQQAKIDDRCDNKRYRYRF